MVSYLKILHSCTHVLREQVEDCPVEPHKTTNNIMDEFHICWHRRVTTVVFAYSSKSGGSKPRKSSPTQPSPMAQYCQHRERNRPTLDCTLL